MRYASLIRKKFLRHCVAILFFSGLSERNISKLGFPMDLVKETLSDSIFIDKMNEILSERCMQIGLLFKLYGIKEEGIYPLPFFLLSLPQYPTLWSFPFHFDCFPEIVKIRYLSIDNENDKTTIAQDVLLSSIKMEKKYLRLKSCNRGKDVRSGIMKNRAIRSLYYFKSNTHNRNKSICPLRRKKHEREVDIQ